MADLPLPPTGADPLASLSELLGCPVSGATATAALTEADFADWKPRAEKFGRIQPLLAAGIAALLEAVARQHGSPALIAYALWIGGNLHHDNDAPLAADAAYCAAAALYDQLGDPLNRARMSVGWVHVLGELARSEEALHLAAQTEAVLAASSDPADAMRLSIFYGNRGIVYERAGQFHAALADYERKWAYYRTAPAVRAADLTEGAMALNDIGVIQALLGQYHAAERSLRAALERLEPAAGDLAVRADITLILMNRAWLATLRQSPYGVVRKAFGRARASRDLLKTAADQLYCAHIELDEANWLIRHGHWRAVDRDALSRLYALADEQKVPAEAFYAALLLGQLAYHAGNLPEAAAAFAHLAETGADKTPTLAYLAHLWQARVARAAGDPAEAEAALQRAITLIEQARGRLTLDDYRAGYLEDKLVAYQDLLLLQLERGDNTAALALSERSKARTLAEEIGQAVQLAPASLAVPAGWSPDAVAAHLAPDMLAISYAEVHEQVWAFLLDRRGLLAPPLCLGPRLSRAELEGGLAKVQRIAYTPTPNGAEVDAQIRLAQAPLGGWYRAYLAPLQPWLDQYAQVLIAPDGLLHALPFACLYDAVHARYLVETHTVIMTPSLALWPALLAAGQTAGVAGQPGGPLIVGNSAVDGRRGALPAAPREAEIVAGLFASPTVLLEGEATLARVTGLAAQARLVYLAAHGVHQPGEPGASYIELGDQPLYGRDILKLELPGSLIVLSACDTGQGQLVGNEMMGLVRSLLHAGAAAVVAAHWQVADSAALDLMTCAMQLLVEGETLAAAVRGAQRAALATCEPQLTHPFFWGALTVTGTGVLFHKEHNQ